MVLTTRKYGRAVALFRPTVALGIHCANLTLPPLRDPWRHLMADHGTVEYATAPGNDYPAHESGYEQFVHFTVVGILFVLNLMFGLAVGGVMGHWFTALPIFIIAIIGLVPGWSATRKLRASWPSCSLPDLRLPGFAALAITGGGRRKRNCRGAWSDRPGEPRVAATPETVKKFKTLVPRSWWRAGRGWRRGYRTPTTRPPAPRSVTMSARTPTWCSRCAGRRPRSSPPTRRARWSSPSWTRTATRPRSSRWRMPGSSPSPWN